MGHRRLLLVWTLQLSFISLHSHQAFRQSDFIDKGQIRSPAALLISQLKSQLERKVLLAGATDIDRCSYYLRDPGVYRVAGGIPRSPYQPVCSTFINSPAGITFNLTFLSMNIPCGMSGAMVINGWQLLDLFKGSLSFVPPEVETEPQRKEIVCGHDVNLSPPSDHTVESSQNFGQLVYDLKPPEELIFMVEFNTGSPQFCNNMISNPSLEPQTYYLSTLHSANCRLYVAGSVAISVDYITNGGGDKTQCGKMGPNLELQGGVSGWNDESLNHHSYFCDKTSAEVKIPCKHVVLSLQNGPAEAKVTIRALQDSEREAWSYLCY